MVGAVVVGGIYYLLANKNRANPADNKTPDNKKKDDKSLDNKKKDDKKDNPPPSTP